MDGSQEPRQAIQAEMGDSALPHRSDSERSVRGGYQEELEERVDQLERKLRRTRLYCLFLILVFLGGLGFLFSTSVLRQRNAVQARLQALRAQQMARQATQRAQALANQRQAKRAFDEALKAPGRQPKLREKSNAKSSGAAK